MELKPDHIRAIIYYQWNINKDPTDVHQTINNVLGQNTVAYSTVTRWIREFRRGRQSLEDDHTSARPTTVTTLENAAIVEKIIRAEPSITFRELEDRSGIARTTLQRICENHLGVKKKLSRFVPHALTTEQKERRLEICRQNLNLWKEGWDNTIAKIVTGDEVYVHYYEPKLPHETKIFVFEDAIPPDVVKKEKSVGKILYAVFFTSSGQVDAVKLEGQKSVTALWYTTKCLPRVLEKGPKSGLMLLHDNAPAHTAWLTTKYLAEKNVKMIPHPPYSPDLAM